MLIFRELSYRERLENSLLENLLELPLKILFVDDEPLILESMRTMLRRQRRRWAMEFVDCPVRASELLLSNPNKFDIVISDMKMPKKDGVSVLETTKKSQSTAVRIMLSGYSDQNEILRAIPVTHQFLGKPCDKSHLVDTLKRCEQLQESTIPTNFRTQLHREAALSADATPHEKFRESLSNCHSETLNFILSHNPALAAKLLQLVSSSFFGMPKTLFDPFDAIDHLGNEIMATLAQSKVLADPIKENRPNTHQYLTNFERCSNFIADFSQEICQQQNIPAQPRVNGLLSCIGLLPYLRKFVMDTKEKGEQPGFPTLSISQVLEASHYLLTLWGLPTELTSIYQTIATNKSGPIIEKPELYVTHLSLLTVIETMTKWSKKHHHLCMLAQVETQEHIQNFDSWYKTQLGKKSLADWQKVCEDIIGAKLAESNRE
ncbi:MAG: response regulator [Myxococcota bacterium]|nr:response regulator [Myxococcota bacterium]